MEAVKFTVAAFSCLLAVSFAGCGGKSEAERDREEAVGQGSAAPAAKVSADGSIQLSPQQAAANAIQTAMPRQESLAPAIAVVGRMQAQPGRESEVVSPFAGRLIAAGASVPRVGSMVKQGQVLAELEQLLTAPERTQYASQITQLEAAAAQAQQEVDLRRVELDRAKQLYDQGAIPLKQHQTAEFNLRQAESRLKSAQDSVAQVQALLSEGDKGPRRVPIVAPVSGTVVSSEITPGMQVDPAKILVRIVDLSTLWVQAAVPESELGAIRQAGRAEVTSPAVPGRIFQATLVTVGPAVDPASRTVPVIYSVRNSDAALKVEMTADVRIPTGPQVPVLLIPASAVLYGAGQSLAFVERAPGSYERRSIVTGESRGSDVVVRSGLKPGEKVVSVGAETLRSELLRGDIPSADK
jgi:cobalt-zinc-cadmium efflux system membrane fusion protein